MYKGDKLIDLKIIVLIKTVVIWNVGKHIYIPVRY